MSGELRVRSMNVADSEVRSVLGPAGNKARLVVSRKPVSKPLSSKVEKTPPSPKEVVAAAVDEKKPIPSPASPVAAKSPPLQSVTVPSVLRRHDQLLHSNFSPNASCSSDASSDSLQSRSSTGRIARSSGTVRRKKQLVSKAEKVVPEKQFESMQEKVVSDGVLDSPPSDTSQSKRRCAWVTPNTDPCYAAFHDEEWGVPVHDDKKLFELLVLSGALAELSWPTILSKRHIFREVFADFDPVAVSKLNEKKILATGSTASSLLSEPKLRAVIDNARQITKVIDEFGSFDKYIWSFVNHKPNISKFRYPRQVPAKTAKADFISKDLLKRGFRSVGATIIYSFMQVAGLTNDHLTSCFRFQECITAASANEVEINKAKAEAMKGENLMDLGLARDMDELSFSSESAFIYHVEENISMVADVKTSGSFIYVYDQVGTHSAGGGR